MTRLMTRSPRQPSSTESERQAPHTPITDVLADVRELFGAAHASVWDVDRSGRRRLG